LWIVLLALAALVLGVGGYLFVITQVGKSELAQVIAELDRTDPGWRWEGLEAKRATYPDSVNSAMQAMVVKSQLPENWQSAQLDLEPWNPEPPVELSEKQTNDLSAELAPLGPALTEARKLKDLPQGRYPSAAPGSNGLPALLEIQQVRTITNLLGHDALLRSQRNDADGAVQSCQAMFNVARSIGDEPTLIALLVRLNCRAIALRKLEQVLAQGQPSDAVLADLQALVADDEAQPLLLIAARGERAFADSEVQALRSGKIKPSQVAGTSGGFKIGPIDLEELFSPFLIGSIARSHAAILRYLTEFVTISRQPVEDQQRLIQKLEAGLPSQPPLVRLLAPAVSKVADAYRRTQAEVRCALLMLAVERYRLKHQRWPETLDALVADKLVARVPTDPYDGAPLRFARVEDGVVIYSIGPDGKDDGGYINRQDPVAAGTDLGFQLWDVARRRQRSKQ
jgi:hypothetical protein